jgi:hypothetical protein
MGLLTDGVRQGNAFESEMRTPPLWGLRWRDPMLHDGRAAGGTFISRTTDAIQQHGPFGEGAASAAAFALLSEDDQAALFRFLDSLGRNEFDYDGDEDVDLDDFHRFQECFNLDNVISPEDPCSTGDVDQDGDVDLVDAGYFIDVYEGELVDCNDNGVVDLLDILSGTAADADGNGELDECFCLGDINGDGEVDGVDLSTLLGFWNTTAPAADLNQSGLVEGGDLAVLLGEWGNCDS